MTVLSVGTNCITQALDEEACNSAPASPRRSRGMKRCKSSVSKLSKMANGPKSTKKWALIAKSLKTFRSVAGSSIKDLVRFRTNGKKFFLCVPEISIKMWLKMCDFFVKKECAKYPFLVHELFLLVFVKKLIIFVINNTFRKSKRIKRSATAVLQAAQSVEQNRIGASLPLFVQRLQ